MMALPANPPRCTGSRANRWMLDVGMASSEKEREHPTSNVQRSTSKGAQLSTFRTALIPSLTNNPTHEEAGWHASGRVGVPPAVLCVPRSTRRSSTGNRIAFGVHVYSAGRPPYPRHAVLLSVRLFVKDGIRLSAAASGGCSARPVPDNRACNAGHGFPFAAARCPRSGWRRSRDCATQAGRWSP